MDSSNMPLGSKSPRRATTEPPVTPGKAPPPPQTPVVDKQQQHQAQHHQRSQSSPATDLHREVTGRIQNTINNNNLNINNNVNNNINQIVWQSPKLSSPSNRPEQQYVARSSSLFPPHLLISAMLWREAVAVSLRVVLTVTVRVMLAYLAAVATAAQVSRMSPRQSQPYDATTEPKAVALNYNTMTEEESFLWMSNNSSSNNMNSKSNNSILLGVLACLATVIVPIQKLLLQSLPGLSLVPVPLLLWIHSKTNILPHLPTRLCEVVFMGRSTSVGEAAATLMSRRLLLALLIGITHVACTAVIEWTALSLVQLLVAVSSDTKQQLYQTVQHNFLLPREGSAAAGSQVGSVLSNNANMHDHGASPWHFCSSFLKEMLVSCAFTMGLLVVPVLLRFNHIFSNTLWLACLGILLPLYRITVDGCHNCGSSLSPTTSLSQALVFRSSSSSWWRAIPQLLGGSWLAGRWMTLYFPDDPKLERTTHYE